MPLPGLGALGGILGGGAAGGGLGGLLTGGALLGGSILGTSSDPKLRQAGAIGQNLALSPFLFGVGGPQKNQNSITEAGGMTPGENAAFQLNPGFSSRPPGLGPSAF